MFQLHLCRLRRQRCTSNTCSEYQRPGGSAVQGTHGHVAQGRTSPRAMNTVAPAHSAGGNRVHGQPVTAQTAPGRTPGLSAPKRKAGSRNPDVVLVNSGSVQITTARLLYIGRMLAASTVPPGSWPCRPSTIRRPVCRSQHPAGLPPFEPFAPQGAGSLLPLRRAARARGSACKKKAGGVAPKTPFIARAISAAAFPQQT